MRIVLLILSALFTVGLTYVLSIPLPVGDAKTPPMGQFLSPQHGFWQNAEPVNADFNASLEFPDLNGKVQVYMDNRLVPHIYAENENDAYFVQGFLHARFRLWQMELQTYAAGGRLSEVLGPKIGETNFVRIDKHFRRLGMVYAAEQTLAVMEADPVTKGELNAYTAGVNAWIASLKDKQLPLEYKLLNYEPEKWTNLKTALFLKYMAYDLAGHDDDFEMTNAKNFLSSTDIEKLYPVFQERLDPIIPRGTPYAPASVVVQPPADADSLYFRSKQDTGVAHGNEPQPDKRNGSNNWVVSGSKTQSGAPILCNDPHLGLNLPSLWYEMQITTPQFSAYGVSFPGAPSIVIGFNDSIAWGVTNSGRDVKDYYEMTFKDSSMQEYYFDGKWNATVFRDELIKVKDSADIHERIAMTALGPVMFDKAYPSPLADGKCYALRWKAHDASNELLAFNRLNRATNYSDYIAATNLFQTPGQNFAFASRSGDIAIRQQGMFPAKWRRQGDYVMPGTDSSYMWKGFIPAVENPLIANPERGFVSSANQLATDETYPYYLGGEANIYRGIIINRKLSQMSGITIKDMQQLQTDNYNVFAEMARPTLLGWLDESKLAGEETIYLDQLKKWNLVNDINETGPTIFSIWWDKFAEMMYADEFGQTKLPVKWPDESTLLESIQRDSAYKFADNITTPEVETIADVALTSWKAAVLQLKKAEDMNKLAWGKYKNTGARHLLKIPALSRLHLPIGGGANIINAATEDHGASWRMIVQMGKTIEAFGIYPGGQSGNPGSKYYDNFIDRWVAGNYFTLLFLSHEEAAKSEEMKWKMTFEKA